MRIACARARPYRLRLARALATARGPLRAREGVLLELCDDAGHRGVGEAAPLPGFHREDARRCGALLGAFAQRAPGAGDRPLAAWRDEAAARLGDAPAARFAAETALLDLAARRRGRPLAALLAPAPRRAVAVSALLSGSEPADLERAAARAVAAGHRAAKLKLRAGPSSPAWQEELARVAAVRQGLGAGPGLRLDAGAAWGEEEALRAVDALVAFRPAWLEQPLPPGRLPACARLRGRGVPLAADEDVTGPEAARRLVAAGAADVLVLKPAVCGLAGGLVVAEIARRAGLGVVVTDFLDGAVGRAAALHLAAALGELPPCGLGSGALLAEDLAPVPSPRAGGLSAEEPGLGVEPAPGRALPGEPAGEAGAPARGAAPCG